MSGAARGERERLERLRAYDILDSAPEQAFDDVVRLATALLEAPMATVTFVDAERQWFKAAIGIDRDGSARSEAFCALTIESDDVFVVDDALRDPRFVHNPFVVGPASVRAYAGAPLVLDDGSRIGTVAVLDGRPRSFTGTQREHLVTLARMTVAVLEERRQRGELRALTEARHEALRRAHERVLVHLDNSPLAVVEWDAAFKVRRWTRSAEALFGFGADEVLGLRPEAWPFVHPDDAAAVGDVMEDLLERRVPRNTSRNRNLRKDGAVITCDWYNSTIALDDGSVSVLSLVDDVTERLEAETRARRAQRLESIGQLTGGVAHDFNNLLTVIVGTAELLDERLAGRVEEQRLLRMLLDAADRGAALTRSLLAFARRTPMAARVCDLGELLDEVSPLLRRSLGETIAFEVRIDQARPVTASIDPLAFEEALVHAALNARDALPDGGRVTLSVGVEPAGDRLGADVAPQCEVVAVRLRDDGVGIEPDLLERVWEPFFSTKTDGEGSGMGLSAVYGFAVQSGGAATLHSLPGRGTTLEIVLPWAAPDGIEPASAVAQPPLAVSVLVVEDNALVRSMVAEQLRSLGYQVSEAADGPSALSLLAGGAPVDLVFTDVVMPGGMSGRELADRARALRPDLPVLLTSGYDDATLASADTGDLPLLPKPYRREALAAAVRDVLQRGGA